MKPDLRPTSTADVQPVTVDLSAASLVTGAPTCVQPSLTPCCRCSQCAGLGYLPIAVADAILIPAIARYVGDSIFSTHDLFAVPELQSVLVGLNPRKLGKRLSAIALEGRVIDGYRVVRVVEERIGLAWLIEAA